jgi:hypothetical protein
MNLVHYLPPATARTIRSITLCSSRSLLGPLPLIGLRGGMSGNMSAFFSACNPSSFTIVSTIQAFKQSRHRNQGLSAGLRHCGRQHTSRHHLQYQRPCIATLPRCPSHLLPIVAQNQALIANPFVGIALSEFYGLLGWDVEAGFTVGVVNFDFGDGSGYLKLQRRLLAYSPARRSLSQCSVYAL